MLVVFFSIKPDRLNWDGLGMNSRGNVSVGGPRGWNCQGGGRPKRNFMDEVK